MSDARPAVSLEAVPGRLMLGYARVSTSDQDLTSQRADLQAAGCTRLYAEKVTGTKRDRPELIRLLDHLRVGDVAAPPAAAPAGVQNL